jgi:hypothetical protein
MNGISWLDLIIMIDIAVVIAIDIANLLATLPRQRISS